MYIRVITCFSTKALQFLFLIGQEAGPGAKARIKELKSGGTDTDCNLNSKQILINQNEDYWNANDFTVGGVLYDVTMCHWVGG